MPGTYPAGPADLRAEGVGVELTIDGMLVVADRSDLAAFTAQGLRPNSSNFTHPCGGLGQLVLQPHVGQRCWRRKAKSEGKT